MDEGKDTIMRMGLEARLEIEKFSADTFETLLKKYKALRDADKFIEESIKKLLNEQIEEVIKIQAEKNSHIKLLEMMSTVFVFEKKAE